MSGEFDWANFVDENSNASMQSVDFSELPLAKLDWDSSRESGLDHSREGLNLQVTKVLNVESNSNCSRASIKRFRGHSPDLSMSKAKRPKTQRALETTASSVASSKDKPELNFKEILNATKEREKVTKEHFNASTNFNTSNGTQIGCSSITSNLGSPAEETGWTERRCQKSCKNEDSTSQPPQTSVCAHLEVRRWLETRGKQKLAKSSQTLIADDRDTCPDGKMLKEQVSERCNSKSSLEKAYSPKTSPVPEEIARKSGIIISNSKSSPESFVWGTHQQSSRTKLFGAADKTKRNCLINPDSESETNAPSVSSVSTTRTHAQSNESMSMATSESDMNAVSVSSVSSPASSINQLQAESYNTTDFFEQPNGKGTAQNHPMKGAYNLSCAPSLGAGSDGLEKPRNTSGGRKGRLTNSCGELKSLSKHQIDMRVRQLTIGKQTWGYQNYIRAVPKSLRSGWYPVTPDPTERVSKRRFNGKVNVWRRKLHFWDAPACVTIPPDGDFSLRPAAVARLDNESKQNRIKYVGKENQVKHTLVRKTSENVDEIKQDQAFHGR